MADLTENDIFRMAGKKYVFELRPGHESARLFLTGTNQVYFFHAGGDCNLVGKNDAIKGYGPWQVVAEDADAVIVEREEKSAIWQKKTVRFVLRDDSIELYFVLKGAGQVEEIRYCRGCEGDLEWGWCGEFDEVFNTAPNFQERLFYAAGQHFTISNGNDLTPDVGGHALASCCHCIGLHDRRDPQYLAVGVATTPGNYTWDDFEWNPKCLIPPTPFIGDQLLGGGFAIKYYGKKTVSGTWETPHLIFTFAKDQHDVLPSYLKHCYKQGYIARPKRRKTAAWWDSPIYCTWHDQGAKALGGRDVNYCKPQPSCGDALNDQLVNEWTNALIDHDCKPGILILDAKWQLNLNDGAPNPKLFPKMREWIEHWHKQGIKVFLWTAAWNDDKLPIEECITRDGKAVCPDITNPAYEKRFREMLRVYFSDAPDCLNADGVKMDGLLSLPTGRGLKNYGDLWGLELQKRYLQVLFEETKKHKKDACVSTFTAHPYLAPYCDMVRIADMYTSRLTSHRTMLYRAEVLKTATPYALIDTDGQFSMYMLDNYADELAEQAKIGIPCLYNGKLVRRHHFFLPVAYNELTDEDYAKISQVLHKYNRERGRE